MTKELLIGCGFSREKQLPSPHGTDWTNLVTLDIDPAVKPDVVWDLAKLPLPFEDDEFTEVHAYHVLEHIAVQGDYIAFFAQFSEFWRILKPDGYLIGTSPLWNSVWAWGDPSIRRVIQRENLVFLDQTQYARQVGVTPLSDFRYIYKADFNPEWIDESGPDFMYVLRAVKPSRLAPRP